MDNSLNLIFAIIWITFIWSLNALKNWLFVQAPPKPSLGYIGPWYPVNSTWIPYLTKDLKIKMPEVDLVQIRTTLYLRMNLKEFGWVNPYTSSKYEICQQISRPTIRIYISKSKRQSVWFWIFCFVLFIYFIPVL